MLSSQKLAKVIAIRYNLDDDAFMDISSLIQAHVLAEIDGFVNRRNLEMRQTLNTPPVRTKLQDQPLNINGREIKIERVNVYPRGR